MPVAGAPRNLFASVFVYFPERKSGGSSPVPTWRAEYFGHDDKFAFLGCSFSDVIAQAVRSRYSIASGRGCFEKSAGLRGVAFLAFEPPFCTAGVLVSADNRGVLIRYSKSGSSDMASKTRCQNSLTSVAVERRDYLGVSTQGICISQLNSTPLGQQNERL
jgi:hypothetical protein